LGEQLPASAGWAGGPEKAGGPGGGKSMQRAAGREWSKKIPWIRANSRRARSSAGKKRVEIKNKCHGYELLQKARQASDSRRRFCWKKGQQAFGHLRVFPRRGRTDPRAAPIGLFRVATSWNIERGVGSVEGSDALGPFGPGSAGQIKGAPSKKQFRCGGPHRPDVVSRPKKNEKFLGPRGAAKRRRMHCSQCAQGENPQKSRNKGTKGTEFLESLYYFLH